MTNNDSGLKPRVLNVNSAFPNFSRPQPVGCFSLNTRRLYEPTTNQLQYFRPPEEVEYPLDLNKGLENAIKKPPSVQDERLDHLFKFIYDHQDVLLLSQAESKRLAAEYVSWRGLLRLIMCTPYEFRQDWCINVTRFNGSCYMVEHETTFKRNQRLNETEEQKKFTAYGFKFEQYCLINHPTEKPNTDQPVDECAEFSCVYQVRLENMPLLFGAEMDGILSDQPVNINDAEDLKKLNFVELKVRQGINCHPRQNASYQRFKTRNWWCQSFLVGISDIFVGLRDVNGLVHTVERISVRSLPKIAQNQWSPNVCANFLVEFLQCISQLMQDVNCPHTVFQFYYNARTERITFKRFNGRSEHSFLPDWYLQIFQQISN